MLIWSLIVIMTLNLSQNHLDAIGRIEAARQILGKATAEILVPRPSTPTVDRMLSEARALLAEADENLPRAFGGEW